MSKRMLMWPVMVTALLLFVLAAGCGQKAEDKEAKKDVPVKKVDDKVAKKADKPKAPAEEERFKVEVGSDDPIKGGGEDALVTIIEISDFECPFCGRVEGTIDKILETYGNDVRVVWKHNPLPFHKNAMNGHVGSIAAQNQGKFWEMHKKLFANRKALSPEDVEKYAKELGLDMAKYKADIADPKTNAKIQKDKAVAQRFQARGTPHFFINGIRLSGAQPFEKFKAVIDKEMAAAKEIKAKGVKNVYAEVIKNAKTKAEAPKPRDQRQEDTTVYKIEIPENSPMKGDKDALITIIEGSEFQCPFCSRVNPTIKKLLEEAYPGKIRIFFVHNPLPFHKDAKLASQAAHAANLQGKFWEFHDKAFANQKALKEDNLKAFAKELGLNMAKFEKDMKDPKTVAKIESDSKLLQKFGARGTPGFFINGRSFSGARPFEMFKSFIDKDILPVAEKLAKEKGLKGDALYKEIIKSGATEAKQQPRRQEEDPNKVYDVPVGKSYFKGGKNAPVELVLFSDYQCPFCARVEPTLDKLEKEFGDKLKIVWKNQPLSFHKRAMPAAKASMAAGEQGKFWEMHKILFENNKKLEDADLEGYAKQIGLNLTKWKAAMESDAIANQIKAEQTLANKVGARGTPTSFINGKKLRGAQPYEAFKKAVEDALKAKKK